MTADTRLKSLADRIEKLMDERDGIQSDIREIYVEAKSAGYVPKVLRKAITRKRMDPDKRDEEDTILDLYEDALSPTMRKVVAMAKAGANSRDIEAATGVDHATVARSVALKKESATGEITTARLDTPPGEGSDLSEGHSASLASDATSAALHGIEDSIPPSANPQTASGPGRSAVTPASSVGIEAGPIHARQDDGLDIPPFLRRQRASA